MATNANTLLCRCVDLRTGAFDVPPQEILTRDSVTINVDAVVYYQVNTVQCTTRTIANCPSCARCPTP